MGRIPCRRLLASLFGLSLASLAATLGVEFASGPAGLSRLDAARLETIRGGNPNYSLRTGNDLCSSQNLGENQRPSDGCDGYPGADCILCDGIAGYSARYGSGGTNATPTGGTDLSCQGLDKWLGVCTHVIGQGYYCKAVLDLQEQCSGAYTPFLSQGTSPSP